MAANEGNRYGTRKEWWLILLPFLVLCWPIARSLRRPDSLDQELMRLAGPRATDCGRGNSTADRVGWNTVSDCAEACFTKRQPFYLRDDQPFLPAWAKGNKFHAEQWINSTAFCPSGKVYWVTYSKTDTSTPPKLEWLELGHPRVSPDPSASYPRRIVTNELRELGGPPSGPSD